MALTYTLRDVIWVLIAAALVMLMQGGFTLLESGLVRAKNSINVAIKNVVDFCLSGAMFWILGFGIMFGASRNGWFGTTGFTPNGENFTPWLMAFFLFQLVFAGTATTIISGAVAERMRFGGYLIVSILVTSLIYPVVGHWIWGGLESGTRVGWLAQRGFIDFAGATVVHSVGGWMSLAAVLVIGPRIGRFDGSSTPLRGHNLVLASLGVLLLWFGWFGFNGGSELGLTEDIPLIMVNTMLSGAFGGLIAVALSWILLRRPAVEVLINGVLAGLVAITASANIMTVSSAVIIGVVAGIICVMLNLLLQVLRIDDAVSAFPVHAGAGVWGTLAVALLGDPAKWETGLTRTEQLSIQALGAGATFLWAFGVGFCLLWLINLIIRFRVSEEAELMGLNLSEHNAQNDVVMLLEQMETQRQTGDLSLRATVEPYTEIGQIAAQYNRVLDSLAVTSLSIETERDDLQNSIIQLLDEVSDVGDGDLTIEAAVGENATGALADSFNYMISQLRDIIFNVQHATLEVTASAGNVQNIAEQIAQKNETQASQLVQTSASVNEMASSVRQVSQNATTSAEVAQQARHGAQRGNEAVQDTIQGMNRIRTQVQETAKNIKRLGESSQEIGEIVQVIRDIAKRTSILSLNASLEAAAAGESGRGFAVVAEDVKRLAERSAEATYQIAELVRNIQTETNLAVSAMEESTQEVVEGSRLANEAGQALTEIEAVSNKLAQLVGNISQTSQKQAQGSEAIARTVSQIAEVTQQNATETREAAGSISDLATLANELRGSVSTFKLPAHSNGQTE